MKTLELRNTVLKYVHTADEHLLQVIKNLVENYKKNVQSDWWAELSKEEQKEIELGLAQAERGEYISHESAMKYFDKWH